VTRTTLPRFAGTAFDAAPADATRKAPATDDVPEQSVPTASSLPLRALALAALARLVPFEADADQPPETRFLMDHGALVGHDPTRWVHAVATALQQPHGADATLVALAGALRLEPIEVLAAALAAAVEEDVMVGRVLAHLQAPLGGSRPMLSLLASTFGAVVPADRSPVEQLVGGAGVAAGLLVPLDDALPLPERALAVPLHLCSAFTGRDGAVAGTSIGVAPDRVVRLPPSMRAEAERHAHALAAAPRRLLVLRTGSDAEGRSVADAIAHAVGRRPLFIEGEPPAAIGPWCTARALLPVFVVEVGPGERRRVGALPGYEGPLLALTGPDGSIDGVAGAAPSWQLPVPPAHERRQLWHGALGDERAADALARDHRHGAGRIAQLARLALHRAALDGRDRADSADVTFASRAGEGTGLDALAQIVPDVVGDDALVLPSAVALEMQRLLLRCHARDGLTDALGASAATRYTPGVRALFVGPSGTGKTLAAAWLATRLGLPLFRVDLASITSKYIGETEKNLAQLLARAERSEVVLLFDEADSLFGKRTDVKDSNDRFANAQTNYLLQRIESFDGIALLTSNSRARFDPAFSRRLDAIVDFPMPGPEERRSLWTAHLGDAHALPAGDLNRLAAAAHLSGGNIRNVVLLAAVLARSAARPIAYADVLQGLLAEYRKLGKQLPVELRR
jgi:ATPase family associated with various cellular activities (AAA)